MFGHEAKSDGPKDRLNYDSHHYHLHPTPPQTKIWKMCSFMKEQQAIKQAITSYCKAFMELSVSIRVSHSVISDSATPWTVAHQSHLSMEFSRQDYWSGLLSPSPGDLPNPGIEPRSPALQADSLPSGPLGKPKCKEGSVERGSSWLLLIKHWPPIYSSPHLPGTELQPAGTLTL